MGNRVGNKRSDRRWVDDAGDLWASKFEWEVYTTLKAIGRNVRRCNSTDTISYTEPKPNVSCLECGSSNCAQNRTYTPDLFLIPQAATSDSDGYYIEVKGYFRDEKRKLFRCLRKARPDIDLRVIFASNHWVTRPKSRLSDYFTRYLKNTPFCFWQGGDIPEEWQ